MKSAVVAACLCLAFISARAADDKFTPLWTRGKPIVGKSLSTDLFPGPIPTIKTCVKGGAQGGGDCTITISVDENCTVTVDPEILIVRGKDVDVEWVLNSSLPDVDFHHAHPIVYRGGQPGDITIPPHGPKRLVHHNKNKNPGTFLYDIWIQHPTPGSDIPQSCGTDPVIVNTG